MEWPILTPHCLWSLPREAQKFLGRLMRRVLSFYIVYLQFCNLIRKYYQLKGRLVPYNRFVFFIQVTDRFFNSSLQSFYRSFSKTSLS